MCEISLFPKNLSDHVIPKMNTRCKHGKINMYACIVRYIYMMNAHTQVLNHQHTGSYTRDDFCEFVLASIHMLTNGDRTFIYVALGMRVLGVQAYTLQIAEDLAKDGQSSHRFALDKRYQLVYSSSSCHIKQKCQAVPIH